MKQNLLSLIIVLLVMFSTNAKAQQVSSRTGQSVEKAVITWNDFNKMPPELQQIVKNNPQRFVLQDKQPKPSNTISISSSDFNKLPQDKKDFILAHPEKYILETGNNAPINSPSN